MHAYTHTCTNTYMHTHKFTPAIQIRKTPSKKVESLYEIMAKKNAETFTKSAHALDDLKERHDELLNPEACMYMYMYACMYVYVSSHTYLQTRDDLKQRKDELLNP